MENWYSVDAVEKFRLLVGGFKSVHRLSHAGLTDVLGDVGSGPSVSTLGRFVESSGFGGDLSIRHMRTVRENLQKFLVSNSQTEVTRKFVQSYYGELRFFNLIAGGGTEFFPGEVNVGIEPHGMLGKYLFLRTSANMEFIVSLAIFHDFDGHHCTIHKLSNYSSSITMECHAFKINSVLYLKGFNPINNSIRFICLRTLQPKDIAMIGTLCGQESFGEVFACRAVMLKIGNDTKTYPELNDVVENHDLRSAVELISRFSPNASLIFSNFHESTLREYIAFNGPGF